VTLVAIWRYASDSAVEALSKRDDFVAALQHHAGAVVDVCAAKIVFTELAANVVLHAPGPIAITLEAADSYAILTVADTGPGFVFAANLPGDLLSAGGRGLYLVSRHCTTVSVERQNAAGTTVSAILPFRMLRVGC
jgi:anti-sigma regulatory factor (Ser/Thr protein kinase)